MSVFCYYTETEMFNVKGLLHFSQRNSYVGIVCFPFSIEPFKLLYCKNKITIGYRSELVPVGESYGLPASSISCQG
jgi:hypothetical protein